MEDYDQPADLGDVTLGKLIDKHEKATLSKGLSSLLNLESDKPIKLREKGVKVTKTETIEFDPMVINEILRVVREKNTQMDSRFDQIEFQLKKLKRFDATDKKFMTAMAVACVLIGTIVGSLISSPKKEEIPLVVNKVETQKVAPQIAAKELMVTKKFVNLRVTNSPKGRKIITISPAQTVQVLGRKGGWVHVEYQNKLTGQKFTGYLWDEYIAELK